MKVSNSLLGDVTKFIRGITFKPDDLVDPASSDAVVCMRTKNIQVDLDQEDLIAVSPAFVRREEQYLNEGDILISTANSWELVGKSCWVPKLDYLATAGGFISILRGNSDEVFPRYLYHWLTSGETQHKLRRCGRQTTNISNMSFDLARQIQIPLPPLPEQRRIAAILDKADAIRHKRQQAIRLTEEFLRSVFLDMFGDPVTNPKGWEVGTIRDLVSEVKYGTSQKAGAEGAYPILRMGNITYKGGWKLNDLKYVDISEKDLSKYLVENGDLLFNRTNSKELVGKTAVFNQDQPMAYAGYLIRVRPNIQNTNEYISGYLNSDHGKKTLVGMCKSIVGMANINAQELQNIKILKAPLEEQRKYQAIVKSVGDFRGALVEPSALTDNLFNALVQRAFRGDL
ncbi:MAG: restriction endonuclease subunit S [Desulfuromusa sp.]